MVYIPKKLWLISDGKAGHARQLSALAGAMHAQAEEVYWQPPRFYASFAKRTGVNWLTFPKDLIPEGIPDAVLSIGNAGILAQAALYTHFSHLRHVPARVHIMSAGKLRKCVDWEICMQHDQNNKQLKKTSQILCTVPPSPYALPDNTPLQPLPNIGSGRSIALLLGGKNCAFNFSPKEAKILGKNLSKMLKNQNIHLYIVSSRRTPKSSVEALRNSLKNHPHYCWDGIAPNPYSNVLHHAESVMVTEDSISMQSDVVHTGKPLYVVRLQTTRKAKLLGSAQKYRCFTRSLIEAGQARYFDGQCEPFATSPSTATKQLAQQILERLTACQHSS